jgi:CheY-like chemotaxis protein
VSLSARNVLLVVDDDPELLALIAEIGRRCGYTVVTADSGTAFASSASRPAVAGDTGPADGRHGWRRRLRHLAASSVKADVLLLSGMDAKVLPHRAPVRLSLGLRMLDALQKPVRMQELEVYLLKHSGECTAHRR